MKSVIFVLLIILVSLAAWGEDLVAIFESGCSVAEVERILTRHNFILLNGYVRVGAGDYCAYIKYQGEGNLQEAINKLRSEEKVMYVYSELDLELNSNDQIQILERIKELNRVLNNDFQSLEQAIAYLSQFPKTSQTVVIYLDTGFLSPSHEVVNLLYEKGGIVAPSQGGYGWDIQLSISKDGKKKEVKLADYEPEDTLGHGTELVSLGLAYIPDLNFMVMKVRNGDKINTRQVKYALGLIMNLLEEREDSDSCRIVINMSFSIPEEAALRVLGSKGWKDFLDDFWRNYIHPLAEKGVIFVSASKNNEGYKNSVHFPGCFGEVISVGIYDGSTFGDFEDLGAFNKERGVDVICPSLYYTTPDFETTKKRYGSSYGTAVTSAFISKILSVNPNLKQNEIELILQLSAQELSSGVGNLVNLLLNGEIAFNSEEVPKVNFYKAARLSSIYSGLKLIKEALEQNSSDKLQEGVRKLAIDLGLTEFPIAIELGDDFSQVVDGIKELYNQNNPSADIPSFYENQGLGEGQVPVEVDIGNAYIGENFN